jgi:Uncharacterised protein family (UPF0153).
MDIISEIEALYSELPELACTQCGSCCVSPTCTLPEFIYLMRYCIQNLTANQLKDKFSARPIMHEEHEGNLRCMFLEKGRCTVHAGRTGACRLFGVPATEHIGIPDMVTCRNKISVVRGQSGEAFIKSWLDRLVKLNKGLYAFNVGPFFINGFNIESWLDICLDPALSFDVFADLKSIMKKHMDLSEYESDYVPQTGLKEKIDKISILNAMATVAGPATVRELLVSIRDDYPFTGTYFLEEAKTLLESWEKNRK